MSTIIRSTVPSDLSDNNYVVCRYSNFSNIDDMFMFIRLMLPYRNIIDYSTYGKLICNNQIIHKQASVVNTGNGRFRLNSNSSSNNDGNYRTYKEIGIKYSTENYDKISELKHLNLNGTSGNYHIQYKYVNQSEPGIYNTSDCSGYLHFYVKTSATLVFVDTKNKCRHIKLPKNQLSELLSLFYVYNDNEFVKTGLADINIGRYIYICDMSYNRSYNRILFNGAEWDVPSDLKPFFSKTKPAVTEYPEHNQYDKTSYKYINDNLEMIMKDLQITNIDNYKPFNQKRYDSIEYISLKDSESNKKLISKREKLIAKLKVIDNDLGKDVIDE